MDNEQRSLSYYLSGMIQILLIALGVLIIYFIYGIEYYDEPETDPETGIVEFDSSIFIFLLIFLVIGSLIFYVIFTKLGPLGIRTVYSISLSFPYLLLIAESFDLLFSSGIVDTRRVGIYLVTVLLPPFGLYFIYIYGRGLLKVTARNTGIIISSVIIGRIMAIYFDLIGIVVIAIVLSIFDIYSVFRGPISKIMGEPSRIDSEQWTLPPKSVLDRQFQQICKKGTPVLISYQNTLLGVGDVLFFAILLYQSYLQWELFGFIITFAMLILGSFGTLFLLKKISPLPGLPLPVLTSMMGYLFLYLVQ